MLIVVMVVSIGSEQIQKNNKKILFSVVNFVLCVLFSF